MRILFLATIACLLSMCTTKSEETVNETVFQANNDAILINVNGKAAVESWNISPEISVDVFNADCHEEINIVTFIDKEDSISFEIALNDTVDFNIITVDGDTAFTRIIGVVPNVTFSEAYIEKHKDKVFVEIREVSELANILVALHKDIEKDKNIVNSETEYYQKVKEYFAPHLGHPIMDTIHKYMTDLRYIEELNDSMFTDEGYLYYYSLKMNACAYVFADEDKIINEGNIQRMADGWGYINPMKDLALIEDFAKVSNFRDFYRENQPYYDEIITTYSTLNPIDKMQTWLDNKFGFSYGCYSIYFSPLIGGAHSTTGFETEDFKQTFMFICPAERDEEYTLVMNELLESRVVFTEIDHNYVNPVSARYMEEIDTIFSHRDLWIQSEASTMYNSPFMVFNEYMTFGVYSLYLNDNYVEEDVLEYLPIMENQMENKRGFIRFKDFNRTMLTKYQEDTTISIEKLYEYMFDWSKKQS